MVVEEFLQFYLDACLDEKRTSVVWSNLYAHHYRNDLSRWDDPVENTFETLNLPRYLLASNEQYFDCLFSILDFGGNLADVAWQLIIRLPTSQGTFAKVTQLSGVRDTEEKNWNEILDPQSSHKLLYTFYIIKYLMTHTTGDGSSNKELNEYLTKNDQQLTSQIATWRKDFIQFGGFSHLFKIFLSF